MNETLTGEEMRTILGEVAVLPLAETTYGRLIPNLLQGSYI
jgi:hypothetical protein